MLVGVVVVEEVDEGVGEVGVESRRVMCKRPSAGAAYIKADGGTDVY